MQYHSLFLSLPRFSVSQRQWDKDTVLPAAAAAAKLLQSCPTLRPHRRQPTRLPRPWDSQGKSTGVGCHFLLQQLMTRRTKDSRTSCTYSSFTCLSQITQSTHIIATGGSGFSKVILRMIVEGSWTHGILPCFLHRYLCNGFWGAVHSQETDASCVKM